MAKRENYGIDAPDVARTFAIISALLLSIAGYAHVYDSPEWLAAFLPTIRATDVRLSGPILLWGVLGRRFSAMKPG